MQISLGFRLQVYVKAGQWRINVKLYRYYMFGEGQEVMVLKQLTDLIFRCRKVQLQVEGWKTQVTSEKEQY